MTLPRLAVVNCVAGRDRSPLVEELGAADWQVLELDGARVRDKESLIGALNEQILGDEAAHNWASLEELLRDAVARLDAASVALVWSDAHEMLAGGLCDLITATDVLTGLSRQLSARERNFVTFLTGDGANFPPLA